MSIAGPGSGNQKRQLAKGMEGLGAPDSRHLAARACVEVRAVGDSREARRSGAGSSSPPLTTAWAPDTVLRSTGSISVFINGAMVGAPLSVTFKVDTPGRYNFYCATQCSTSELHPKMHGVLIVD